MSGTRHPDPPQRESWFVLRARLLIERAIRRRWLDGLITRDPDGLLTAFLGGKEIERLMAGGAPPADAEVPEHADEDLPEAEIDLASPLGALTTALSLSPTEIDLIAALLSCEADPVSARLMQYLSGNQTQFTPTADLLLEIVYRVRRLTQGEAAARLHHDISPRRSLRRLRFLLVEGAESRVSLAQSIRLHPRLTAWLLGDPGLDPELGGGAHLFEPELPDGECDPDNLSRALSTLAAGERLLFVEGAPGSGREMLLRFAAHELSRPMLILSGRGFPADRLVLAFREALLMRALLVITDADEVLAGEGLARLREALEVFPHPVSLIGCHTAGPFAATLRPSDTVVIEVPPLARRAELWRRYLGPESDLSDDDLRSIAGLYNLGIGGIVSAARRARESASFAGRRPTRVDVADALRRLYDADLATVATRATVTQDWDDLVLPADLRESVESIIDRVRFRAEVYGRWGFDKKLGKGLGLTVLFSGTPGTGKSMAAGLVARALGLDLYVINLSQLMSKWLGETEKNLARAFDAAEVGHVLLLFDEADAILGKRVAETRGANDRYANLGTNFILARLEQFQGIAIFTTNLSSALDPAVSRRMSMQIQFPFPDAETRAELWRRLLPAEAPIDDDIDFDELSERFELSGGVIRNLVVRAAFAAARDGRSISMAYLLDATEREYRERGSIVTSGKLS